MALLHLFSINRKYCFINGAIVVSSTFVGYMTVVIAIAVGFIFLYPVYVNG